MIFNQMLHKGKSSGAKVYRAVVHEKDYKVDDRNIEIPENGVEMQVKIIGYNECRDQDDAYQKLLSEVKAI